MKLFKEKLNRPTDSAYDVFNALDCSIPMAELEIEHEEFEILPLLEFLKRQREQENEVK